MIYLCVSYILDINRIKLKIVWVCVYCCSCPSLHFHDCNVNIIYIDMYINTSICSLLGHIALSVSFVSTSESFYYRVHSTFAVVFNFLLLGSSYFQK